MLGTVRLCPHRLRVRSRTEGVKVPSIRSETDESKGFGYVSELLELDGGHSLAPVFLIGKRSMVQAHPGPQPGLRPDLDSVVSLDPVAGQGWILCRKPCAENRVVACRTMKRFLITGDAAGARALAGPRAER